MVTQTQSYSVLSWPYYSTSVPLPKIFPRWEGHCAAGAGTYGCSPETVSYLVLSSIHCWLGASRRDKWRQRPWAGSPEAVSRTCVVRGLLSVAMLPSWAERVNVSPLAPVCTGPTVPVKKANKELYCPEAG